MANAQEAKRERPLDRGAFLLVYIVGQKRERLQQFVKTLPYQNLPKTDWSSD